MSYQEKYLKYKKKYLALKNQLGGNWICPVCKEDNEDSRSTCIKMACSGQKPEPAAAAGVDQHDVVSPAAVAPDTPERAVKLFSHGKLGWGSYIRDFLGNRETNAMGSVNKATKEAVKERWANPMIAGEFVLSTVSWGGQFGRLSGLKGLSLTPDESLLLACDMHNNRVLVVDAHNGSILRSLKGTLNSPMKAVVVPRTGQVLVLDNRCKIVVFAGVDNETEHTLGEGYGRGLLQLSSPFDLAVLDGDEPVVVIADTYNSRLALWRVRDGSLVRHIGSKGTNPGQFAHPTAVTVVPAQSTGTGEARLVVVDSKYGASRVQLLTPTGDVLRVLQDNADIKLGSWLGGVTVCIGTGEVLVTDEQEHFVVAWRLSDGGLRVVCGMKGSEPGKFFMPWGVVASSNGALWVADSGNNRLCLFR